MKTARSFQRLIGHCCFIMFLCLLAGCEKHVFEPGDRVMRKGNPNIRGVIVLRSNLNGAGDVYYFAYKNEDGKRAFDGPNQANELERAK